MRLKDGGFDMDMNDVMETKSKDAVYGLNRNLFEIVTVERLEGRVIDSKTIIPRFKFGVQVLGYNHHKFWVGTDYEFRPGEPDGYLITENNGVSMQFDLHSKNLDEMHHKIFVGGYRKTPVRRTAKLIWAAEIETPEQLLAEINNELDLGIRSQEWFQGYLSCGEWKREYGEVPAFVFN